VGDFPSTLNINETSIASKMGLIGCNRVLGTRLQPQRCKHCRDFVFSRGLPRKNSRHPVSGWSLTLSPVGKDYRRVGVENISIVSDIEAFFPAFDKATIHP